MENIIAILQARTSSTRLVNKVLKPILGKEMLLHQIERIQNSQLINKLIVATSNNNEDKKIVELCKKNYIEVFAGSLNNVLDRYYQCYKKHPAQHIVRLTADCPVTDWEVIDQLIYYHLRKQFDYTNNAVIATYPDGLDAEIMTANTLEEVWQKATKPSQKEHVTLYINDHKKQFKIGILKSKINLSHLRWTVDELEDFILIEKIYQTLYVNNPKFLTQDILNLLKNQPGLTRINQLFQRNEGLQKSLKGDTMQ